MLVTMKEILEHASANDYAVAAPNVVCEIDARAAIYAAEEMNAPLILDVAPIQTPDVTFLGRYLAMLAEDTPIPVALNLDHGGAAHGAKSDDIIVTDVMNALKGDFTSVMIDRSSFPYEENVAQVKELTRMAHAIGVSVEAELGHVGDGSKYETERDAALTEPSLARDYVERTGIDCLAVAVGNAHGAYHGTPFLDFDRLTEIKKAVNGLPLVLHGGSGTGIENLRKACTMGINKVNICMDLMINVGREMHKSDLAGNEAYEFWVVFQKAWSEKLMELIEVFGGKDKAWKPEKVYIPAKEKLYPSMKES